ncbi:hypothetical protein [Streptomyces sp. NPDC048057]|uniref:hypothetical protein n=1 Tax=Streptomyces sp. NPDC048057 TaxID=3155628 RepID=UPI0033D63EC1
MSANDRRGAWLGGCAGLLCVMGIITLMAAGCSASALDLSYESGARPIKGTELTGMKYVNHMHEYGWDVRQRIESTFIIPYSFGTSEVGSLDGTLQVSVPDGCADRTVRWEIDVDRAPLRSEQVRWVHAYDVEIDTSVHGRPRTVTIKAEWDGGTESCPSFTLTWQNPKITMEPDPNFMNPDFYP